MGIFRKFIEDRAGEAVIAPIPDGTLNPDVSAEIHDKLKRERVMILPRNVATTRHEVENVMGSIAFGQ